MKWYEKALTDMDRAIALDSHKKLKESRSNIQRMIETERTHLREAQKIVDQHNKKLTVAQKQQVAAPVTPPKKNSNTDQQVAVAAATIIPRETKIICKCMLCKCTLTDVQEYIHMECHGKCSVHVHSRCYNEQKRGGKEMHLCMTPDCGCTLKSCNLLLGAYGTNKEKEFSWSRSFIGCLRHKQEKELGGTFHNDTRKVPKEKKKPIEKVMQPAGQKQLMLLPETRHEQKEVLLSVKDQNKYRHENKNNEKEVSPSVEDRHQEKDRQQEIEVVSYSNGKDLLARFRGQKIVRGRVVSLNRIRMGNIERDYEVGAELKIGDNVECTIEKEVIVRVKKLVL